MSFPSFLRALVLIGANALVLGAATAHDLRDPLPSAPVAPATGAVEERLAGRIHHLTIDDRVAGAVIDYPTLTLDDGRAVVLRGDATGNIPTGARVEATGERNGKALFVRAARELAPADRTAASAKAKLAQVEGTLALLHVDYFDEARSAFLVEIEDASGRRTPVHFPVVPEALRAGMRVSVSGETAQGVTGIVPDTVSILASPASAPVAKASVAKAVTTNNVLFILMTFTDSPAAPFTQAAVQSVVGGGPGSGSVTEYFKEASYGQQLMNPTVTPWLATGAATPAACDYQQIGTIGRNAAVAAGYNLASYQNIAYVFPPNSACGWIGLAYIGASGVWINGRNMTSAYGHELGHNLGLLHAGSVRCSAGAIGGSCSVSEYGDPFDIMGNQSAMHVNAMQKADLGWIPASSVVTHAPGSTTYTLTPIESGGGATYAIKIPAATNRTYWVEYRQPIGFDAGLASYPNNGAQIRVASPFETLCSGCDSYSNDTQLLDMTTGTSVFTDAALTVGNAYTDSTYGININVLSASATGLTVQVTTSSPSAAPTTTTLASSANPAAQGAPVTMTATVTGSAPSGVVAFTENGAALAGCSAITLAGSGNSKTAACTTSTLSAGAHNLVARYAGDAANAASTSATLAETINGGALGNGGFETPKVSAYVYAPTGASWIFNGAAGISANASAFTSGNPAAPEGVQVGFLQNAAAMSQTISLAAGQYTVSLKAAQRGNKTNGGTQIVQIQVDGAAVGQFQPPSSAYAAYQTAAFTVAASGNHTLRLSGVGSGTDYTAFVDNVQIVAGGTAAPPAPPAATTTTLASSANPAAQGGAVTLTATVTGTSPTGTIQFADGATILSGCSAVALGGSGNSRTAACTTSTLTAGTHSIVATYSGDATNAASSSTALAQAINSVTPAGTFANGGFETPRVSTYVYAPTGATWTFLGAGISANYSAFTSGNPVAPQGTQVAFVQNAGSMSQALALSAGQYTVSLKAAQRGNKTNGGSQIVQIQMDGVTVGQFQPPSNAYTLYQTAAFTVASTGNHTLKLSGVGSGTDYTAFVDDVQLVVATGPLNGAVAAGDPRSGSANGVGRNR